MTTRHVGMLLKSEVLGSSNTKRTTNLIMGLKMTHNEGLGVGALQGFEPGSEWAGRIVRNCRLFMWQPVPLTGTPGSHFWRTPTLTPPLWVFSDSIIMLLVRLALFKPKTSPFTNTPTWRVVISKWDGLSHLRSKNMLSGQKYSLRHVENRIRRIYVCTYLG